jgi:hypothetical protein
MGKPLWAVIFLAVLSLAACMNGEERSLGANYYLIDGDDAHVYLTKKSDGKSSVVIDQQIVDVKVVNDYVFVRRKVAESFDCYDKNNIPSIITHYTEQDEYWVIDLNKGKETGPLKEEAYFQMLRDLGLPLTKLKVRYYFVPNSDAFKKLRSECKNMVRL